MKSVWCRRVVAKSSGDAFAWQSCGVSQTGLADVDRHGRAVTVTFTISSFYSHNSLGQ